MKILTFNVGSSSIKLGYFDNDKLIDKKNFEEVRDKDQRIKVIKEILKETKKIKFVPDIIVHRVVHGKDLDSPKKIDDELIEILKDISILAPLHLIPELDVIKECKKSFNCKQFAIFDTSYYKTLSIEKKMYAIPYKYYEKGIKKYGFHGISHKFVTKNIKGKTISLHLGSGCSITASIDNKALDTTMGFTPLEGIIMSTRSGSLDPAIIPHLMKHENLSIDEISNMLNKQSGLLGISQKSADMRVLLNSEDKFSKLAINAFCFKAKKALLSMLASLDGLDNIVFTGGIGEKSHLIRKKIVGSLDFLGILIDSEKNEKNEKIISSSKSKVKVFVVKTNEEKEMAMQCINK